MSRVNDPHRQLIYVHDSLLVDSRNQHSGASFCWTHWSPFLFNKYIFFWLLAVLVCGC